MLGLASSIKAHMSDETNLFISNLMKRLADRGMESCLIPGFIRSLANILLVHPRMNLLQVNKQLHFLGWDGVELDYHTLELAIACFEAEGLNPTKRSHPAAIRSILNRVMAALEEKS